jgi:hypothetical protein
MIEGNRNILVEAPPLTSLVKKIPEEIKYGNLLEFPKPIQLIGYPVLKGSVKKRSANFGPKSPFLVTRGKIIDVAKNIIMLQTKVDNLEIVFPLQLQ